MSCPTSQKDIFRSDRFRREKEEYRLFNDYWTKRLLFRDYNHLVIVAGYPKNNAGALHMAYHGYEIKRSIIRYSVVIR